MSAPSSSGDAIEPTPSAVAAAMVEPLKSSPAELRTYLQDDLRQRLEAAPELKRGDVTLPQAAEKLAAAGRRTWKEPWLAAGSCAALLLIATAVIVLIPKILTWQEGQSFSAEPKSFGNLWKEEAAWERPNNWQLNRDDAAAYMGWAMAKATHRLSPSHTGSPGWPQDYDETWQRLDPDNAAWLILKARFIANSEDHLDANVQKAVWETLTRASQMSRCETYGLQRESIRRSSLRTPENWPEASIIERCIVNSGSQQCEVFPDWGYLFLRLDLMRADGANDEAKEFSRVIRRCIAMEIRGKVLSGDSGWDQDMATLRQQLFPVMHTAAGSSTGSAPPPLDGTNSGTVNDLLEIISDLSRRRGTQALLDDSSRHSIRSPIHPLSEQLRLRLQRPVAAILKGELLYNMQILTTGLAVLAWGIFVLLRLRQRIGPASAVKGAACFHPLLDGRGYGWLALWGLVIPMIAVGGMLSFQILPAHPRPDLMWTGTLYGIVLVLVSTAQAARSRISRFTRLAGFPPGKDGLWSGRIAAVLTMVAMLFFSATRHGLMPGTRVSSVPWLSLACVGAGILWLSVKLMTGFVSRQSSTRQALIARWLQPPVLVLAIALGGLTIALHFAEKRAVAAWREEAAQPRPDPGLARRAEEILAKFERGE